MSQNDSASAANGLIKDTTTETFVKDVIEELKRQPVLVDIWAEWCGPCKQLGPVLEKVVRAAKGKVKLVKIDIDKHPSIPGQLGIQYIPSVFAFINGQPFDGFLGVQLESRVTAFIEALAVGEPDAGDRHVRTKHLPRPDLEQKADRTYPVGVYFNVDRRTAHQVVQIEGSETAKEAQPRVALPNSEIPLPTNATKRLRNRIFVSHVMENCRPALEIVGELERRGIDCWIAPRNVRPGRPFDDEIAEAIEGCRAMLLIFSEFCNDNDYIRREVTLAGEARKLIIPLRIEDVQPRKGLRVRLADLHWIDAFVAREEAISDLVAALKTGEDHDDASHSS